MPGRSHNNAVPRQAGVTLATGSDRVVRDAMLFAAVFALFPLANAWSGLDNYFWCEEGATIRWVGAILDDPVRLFDFYGIAFYPVTMAVMTLQIMVLGASPTAVHGTDLALHVLNGVLLAGLFARWLKDPVVAALAALAWMLSRHTDEAIFWMGARQHALAFLFVLLAWHADERGRRNWSVVCAVAAVLSKEVGLLIVPLVTARRMLLTEAVAIRERIRASLAATWRLWALAAAYLAFRAIVAFFGGNDGRQALGISGLPLHKVAYLPLQFIELGFLPWERNTTLLVALVIFGLAFWRGSALSRFGFAWMFLALLPFQPLTHFSSRYTLFPFAGFLIAVAGFWLSLSHARKATLQVPVLALIIGALFYQGYIVFLDEKDYDMRSRFVEQLAREYESVAAQVPDGLVAVMPVSGLDAQPVVNERCFIPKLNAPISNGLWGIIPAEDLVGLVEFSRGRAWIPAGSAPPGSTLLVHRGDTFVVTVLTESETRPLVFGRLVRL